MSANWLQASERKLVVEMSVLPLSEAEGGALLAPLSCFSHLALAVSGGPDSLALMQLAASWAARASVRPTVLTVDHGLRPDAKNEAEAVAAMAAGLGLSHATLQWLPDACAHAHAGGLQARARTARYDLLAAYCHAHDIEALVTAHHLDDQAETVLMRLKRGSGLDGLAAMSAESAWGGIAVLRPLLDVPKARLVATLATRGVSFATDPSNSDPRFERAQLRGDSAALRRLGLTPEALARSARRLRRAREALEHATDAFLAAHCETHSAGYCRLDAAALASQPEEIALRALGRVIAAVSGREEPLQLAKLEALAVSLAGAPGKARTLGACRLQPFAGGLGVFREVRTRLPLPVLSLDPGAQALWDNRFRVALDEAARGPVTVRALGEAGFIELRRKLPWLATLPRLAGLTLPACWRGDSLMDLPRPGVLAEGSGPGLRAAFVSLAH